VPLVLRFLLLLTVPKRLSDTENDTSRKSALKKGIVLPLVPFGAVFQGAFLLLGCFDA